MIKPTLFSLALQYVAWSCSNFIITPVYGFASCDITSRTSMAFSGQRISRFPPVLSSKSRLRPLWTKLQERDESIAIPPSSPFFDDNNKDSDDDSNNPLVSRKQALKTLTGLMAVSTLALSSSSLYPSPCNAFDKTFPTELTEIDEQSRTVTIGSRTNALQRKQTAEQNKEKMKQNLVNFNVMNDGGPSLLWGIALWLLSGSRSNPLTTPLANVMYDAREEKWLQDRNAGLFAPPPTPLLLLLGVTFIILGTVTQFLLLQLAEGDSGVCGQLAGVSLIGGIFLEIGRIASGEKSLTRDEMDRAILLKNEFDEFASKRLIPGGNCHRSDVVRSFRRYYGKYRQPDSEQYPLTDLEIEKLLRGWNKYENQGKAEMTSSGFYYGIQINTDADIMAR